jgi:hypothetical protein
MYAINKSGTAFRAINSEDELLSGETFSPELPTLLPSSEELISRIDIVVQGALDKKAQAKGYADAATCISYLNSSNADWAADANKMNIWRDKVWAYVFGQEQLLPLPTPAEVEAGLPAAPW